CSVRRAKPAPRRVFSSRRGSLRCVKPSRLMLAASECVVLSRWTCAQRGATIARRSRGALWNVNGARWRLFPGSYPCCGRGGPRGRGGRGARECSSPDAYGCSLHVDDAHQLVAEAEEAVERARKVVRSSLVNMASLLRQPALRSLLEQGKNEPFIAEVLAAPDDDTLADILAERIAADPGNARLLARYLKRIVVRVIRLSDFKPSKTKVDKGDIEAVVGEFHEFLETALGADGAEQSTIAEIR